MIRSGSSDVSESESEGVGVRRWRLRLPVGGEERGGCFAPRVYDDVGA